jgi:hypothetical protein
MMQRKLTQYHTGIAWLDTDRRMTDMNSVPEIHPAAGLCP